MNTQPEQILENNLMAQLEKLGYQGVAIKDENDLLTNLKLQLEEHNDTTLCEQDFKQILNYINKGNIFERAKILRDRVPYINDKGENKTINVAYILKLLAKLKDSTTAEQEKQKKAIIELISGDVQMRSKRELIEKFIHENLPEIADSDNIPDEFDEFWSNERVLALEKLSKDENLDAEKLQEVIGNYLFTEKKPLRDEIIEIMNKRPGLKERKTVAERVTEKILGFVETFINGIIGN